MDQQEFGFRAWLGQPQPMATPHRHSDIEVNLILEGGFSYLFGGGGVVEVPAARLCVFWAAIPHQMIAFQPGTRTSWITLPLGWLFAWSLPGEFTQRVLAGHPVIDPAPMPGDVDAIVRWSHDTAHSTETREIAALEIQARLRRLAAAVRDRADAASATPARQLGENDASLAAVETMARLMASRFRDPLTVADMADAAGLHPNYAMHLFKRYTGTTLVAYLTRHRLAHAQRLLATTDLPVLEIALESGFGSASRFYEIFTRELGATPRAYRQRIRTGRDEEKKPELPGKAGKQERTRKSA